MVDYYDYDYDYFVIAVPTPTPRPTVRPTPVPKGEITSLFLCLELGGHRFYRSIDEAKSGRIIFFLTL